MRIWCYAIQVGPIFAREPTIQHDYKTPHTTRTMGYLRNHLATVVAGVFAGVMSLLWVYFNGFAPVLDFIFLMAVPISWFLVVILWLSQKSADYMHNMGHGTPHQTVATTSTERSADTELVQPDAEDTIDEDVVEARAELNAEFEALKKSAQLKDEQIKTLKQQITNLQTQVEIESIRADIAKLREMAKR